MRPRKRFFFLKKRTYISRRNLYGWFDSNAVADHARCPGISLAYHLISLHSRRFPSRSQAGQGPRGQRSSASAGPRRNRAALALGFAGDSARAGRRAIACTRADADPYTDADSYTSANPYADANALSNGQANILSNSEASVEVQGTRAFADREV
jgi:hypothetical protein